MPKAPQSWSSAVSAFGAACEAKLAGPGDREAAIRAPLEALLKAAGAQLGVEAVFHDEVRDVDRQVRPDYGVSVMGAITGYIEVKAFRHIHDAHYGVCELDLEVCKLRDVSVRGIV